MSTPGNANGYDVIVVGGGHNGLALATLLGKRKKRVLVVEKNPFLGGIAAGPEFHPGYRSGGLLHDTSAVRPRLVSELGLESHGLKLRSQRPSVLALGGDRRLLIDGNPLQACKQIAALSGRDAESYGQLHAFLDRVRPVIQRFLDRRPLDILDIEHESPFELLATALGIRRLGKKDMMNMLRTVPMCVSDLLSDWFETDLLKAALALPAVAGNFLGPRSPASAANLLLTECAATPGIEGGATALVAALERAARAVGVEVRASSEVTRILVQDGRATGVALGGETIAAAQVVASCSPKHALLDLLPPSTLSFKTEDRIKHFRAWGTTAQLLLATSAPVEFPDAPGVHVARTGSHLDDLEKAFDALKYRRFSERPVLEIHLASAENPSLAPTGGAVISVLIHFAPYELASGWSDTAREELAKRALLELERHLPGLSKSVVAKKVLAPPDLEHVYGLPKGHIFHGEHGLDQMLVRPIPECGGYATPVTGLFLASSGCHPMGGLSGIQALLCAEAM